ncbi:ADP-ribosyl-[dinitrogen reductase] glycohydrolase [compost metagenome]
MNQDKVKGALLGVAVGDALGGPMEFMSSSEIKHRYGRVTEMLGGGWLNLRPGEVTDDTEMTLCVAYGIASSPKKPLRDIGMNFVAWIHQAKDVGETCRLAILHAKKTANLSENPDWDDVWRKAAQYADFKLNGKSAGNGSLMRTIYPALYYDDEEQAAHIAAMQSQMTHYDPVSAEVCAWYVRLVHRIVRGMNKEQLTKEIQWRYPELIHPCEPTGYVMDTLSCALRSVLYSSSAEEAIIHAANLGGDTDTIAAIAGGIAGALYGAQSLPKRWIQALTPEIRSQIDELTQVVFNHSVQFESILSLPG